MNNKSYYFTAIISQVILIFKIVIFLWATSVFTFHHWLHILLNLICILQFHLLIWNSVSFWAKCAGYSILGEFVKLLIVCPNHSLSVDLWWLLLLWPALQECLPSNHTSFCTCFQVPLWKNFTSPLSKANCRPYVPPLRSEWLHSLD